MHLLFIDESGTPTPLGKSGPEYFVLGGVIIPEETWLKINKTFKTIKRKYNIDGEIKWRFFSSDNKRDDNSLLHLPPTQRQELRKELLNLLTGFNSVTIIAALCHVPSCYMHPQTDNEEALYHLAYKMLSERFQYHLQDISRNFGQTVSGMIICDHRDRHSDNQLRQLHELLMSKSDAHFSGYKNIIEGLLIAPSHFSLGIQFADLVAGSIYRKFNSGDETAYEMIKTRIRSSNDNKIKGYGICVIPSGYEGVAL